MTIIRPIRESDFSDLKGFVAGEAGLTSLPNDEEYLKGKIEDSLKAFDSKVRRPGGESYLFVLEHEGRVVGTSGILSKVGGFQPFYTYKIITEHCEDARLRVKKDIPVLHLVLSHDGPTEICSLFLVSQFRRGGFGRLLSLSRFLFMAEFSRRFDQRVISEVRGVLDQEGRSPFWEHVGRHFFETDFSRADFLSGLGHKEFIKNLMPRYPIYIPLLPVEVQRIIGKAHHQAEAALKLLMSEGFRGTDEVDIFDAGPTVAATMDQIRSIRDCQRLVVEGIADSIDSEDYIVANTRLDFRACVAKIERVGKEAVCLTEQAAHDLGVKKGDAVRVVELLRGTEVSLRHGS